MNALIQPYQIGHIKLLKNGSKDIYKDFGLINLINQ